MTGTLLVDPPPDAPHTRVRLTLDDGTTLTGTTDADGLLEIDRDAKIPDAAVDGLKSLGALGMKSPAEVAALLGAEGVLFAHGSRFGGHSLFIKDGKLHYVYNFLGIKPEQKFISGKLKLPELQEVAEAL